jgi:hypothetical protein
MILSSSYAIVLHSTKLPPQQIFTPQIAGTTLTGYNSHDCYAGITGCTKLKITKVE